MQSKSSFKIAIVDDEKQWTLKVEERVRTYLGNMDFTLKCYSSGEEFLANNEDFTIVFMDIEMPGLDGFSVLEEYRKEHRKSIYIILTTHVELSRNGYKVEAFRYIDKYCLEEIGEALDSALLRLKRYQMIEVPVLSKNNLQISCYDIVYFEVYGHEVLMHMADGEVLKCAETLSELSKRLEETSFVMTGRSYLVNLDHMKKVEPNDIFMDTGESIPLSRRKYAEIRKVYFDWKMKRANG